MFLKRIVVLGACMLTGFICAANNVPVKPDVIIEPHYTTEQIRIDGLLDEPVWQEPGLREVFKTFNPTFGDELGEDTIVWTAYDDHSLYFAFRCFDSRPDLIKTSMSKRDSISRDDWVGVVLDSLGNLQSTCEFYVNPHGIQDDGITSAVNGWAFDPSPDFVWDSAASIDTSGYTVEIRIPLKSIRFVNGETVTMNVMFLRNISRLGMMACWPEIAAGQNQFQFMVPVHYGNISSRLNLEVLPSLAYNRSEKRQDNETWGNPEDDVNLGISVKYGISSSIVLEGTLNPDYSQIESDAFQVEVNQRYPVFYNEKRPFFMEAADALDFAIVRSGMMLSTIHTRNIVDPAWAGKISGTTGKFRFAGLLASDDAPGHVWETGINPHEGEDAFWGIFRTKYSMGSDNSVGLLLTGHTFNGDRNRVAGIDYQRRFRRNYRFTASYLGSVSRFDGESVDRNDSGINLMMEYGSRNLDAWLTFERYGTDFAMDTAFLRQTGVSRTQLYLAPNRYLDSSIIRRIQPYFRYLIQKDLFTDLDDQERAYGVTLYTTRNGLFRYQFRDDREYWAGTGFKERFSFLYAQIQLTNWVFVAGSYRLGDRIYYHPTDPEMGDSAELDFNMMLQPVDGLSIDFEYIHQKLDRTNGSGGGNLYDLKILNFRAAYQFNRYFFIRGALRYNGYSRRMVTDFLASYTLRPGTVVHIGYGSLYDNQIFEDDQGIPGDGSMVEKQRTLFFKVSYLWRSS